MLHLILADSELELVPSVMWNHPAVIKHAQKRGKKQKNIILDSTYHHSAIREYFPEDENRRGRPDIVHYFLLNTLESPANLLNKVRVYVHTRNNDVIYVNPEVKIPKSYNRFIGLMEDLFHNGYVPSKEKPLLWIEEMDLNSLIKKLNIENISLLSSEGKGKNASEILNEDHIIIIGGFPSGNYLSNVSKYEPVSIFGQPLTAWVVAYEIIVNYELKFLSSYFPHS